MTKLLTVPMSNAKPADVAEAWAISHERWLRELRYRFDHPDDALVEASLTEFVPARDAGDVCHVCGEIVTWVDHLPPVDGKSGVQCFANVSYIPTALGVVVDDIFPRV